MSSDGRVFEGIWIPAELWLSKDLSITQKVIFLEIKSMDKEFGCVATNNKIGSVLEIKGGTVSSILKILEEKGYIKISYKDMITHAGRVINALKFSNKITPLEKSIGALKESNPLIEKSIHSNTISNTISNVDSKLSNAEFPSETSATPLLSDMDKCRMFIEKFNETKLVKGKKGQYKDSTAICGQLKQRLKKYKSAEIFKALIVAMKDTYHIETTFKYITPEYILREKILERYLNQITDEVEQKEERKLVH